MLRRINVCKRGHALKEGEYYQTCSVCQEEKAAGLHKKTHCTNGHELIPANIIMVNNRTHIARRCRKCHMACQNKSVQKRKIKNMTSRATTLKQLDNLIRRSKKRVVKYPQGHELRTLLEKAIVELRSQYNSMQRNG